MYLDYGCPLYNDIDDFMKVNSIRFSKRDKAGIDKIKISDPEYIENYIYLVNLNEMYEFISDNYIPYMMDYLTRGNEQVESTLFTKQFISTLDEIRMGISACPPRCLMLNFPKGIKSKSLVKHLGPILGGDKTGKNACWFLMFPYESMRIPHKIANIIFNGLES